MTEFYSRAIVLERDNFGETDSVVYLFTEKYGKVVAKARSLRKITSKSSAHLQPLQIIQVRFVSSKKTDGMFVVMDVLWDEDTGSSVSKIRYDLLPIMRCLNKLMSEFQLEPHVWTLLETALKEPYTPVDVTRALLHILGFNPRYAQCSICLQKPVKLFLVEKNIFLCASCTSQVSTDALVLEI